MNDIDMGTGPEFFPQCKCIFLFISDFSVRSRNVAKTFKFNTYSKIFWVKKNLCSPPKIILTQSMFTFKRAKVKVALRHLQWKSMGPIFEGLKAVM